MCLLDICLQFFRTFDIVFFFFFAIYRSYLYILDSVSFWRYMYCNIFSQSVAYFCIFLTFKALKTSSWWNLLVFFSLLKLMLFMSYVKKFDLPQSCEDILLCFLPEVVWCWLICFTWWYGVTSEFHLSHGCVQAISTALLLKGFFSSHCNVKVPLCGSVSRLPIKAPPPPSYPCAHITLHWLGLLHDSWRQVVGGFQIGSSNKILLNIKPIIILA